MPMDRSLYPPNWDEIAARIKDEVDWCCEFCGRTCMRPGESAEDFIKRISTTESPEDCPTVADFTAFPRRYVLSVAHLNHVPGDCERGNLKALCTSCHCRYDLRQMGRKQYLKRERHGQLRIEWEMAVKLEGVQLALLPEVESYWLKNAVPARRTNCS
jgi:hypothetical protein